MLTHVDKKNRPQMVDVSPKTSSLRIAKAQSVVVVPDCILEQFKDGDIQTKKGAVFHTAIIAGTMAAKKTSELIPFCHDLLLESIKININLNENNEILIECEVKTENKTGVEMEALCGASVAALTIYDMCKAMSHEIHIENTCLVSKSGGESNYEKQ